MKIHRPPYSPLIQQALSAAQQTRDLRIGRDQLRAVPEIFQEQFGNAAAAIIADTNTFAAAGRVVHQALNQTGHPVLEPFIFDDPALYAEHTYVEKLQNWLGTNQVIPVAVGSGTINDLTKLAAHRTGRRYMSVATAASMDGYTAFGASITYRGSKQTFDCPAPQAVVADLDVIAAAPPAMNAAGYADLLAKITAGADWIVADALGIEPIDPTAWNLVQKPLKFALSNPEGVKLGDLDAISRLTEGLMMGGFAMQYTRTSRPASGAEHQFSHLWDMQHHSFEGHVPSHGFKVAVGTISIARLYEYLLAGGLDQIDIDRTIANWPSALQIEQMIHRLLGNGELAAKASSEMQAKSIDQRALRAQLNRLVDCWPALAARLREHLPPVNELIRMLSAAGAPTEPEQIGISRQRLRDSFRQAYLIRRRFTVLDLVARAGLFEPSLDALFGSAGPWPLT